jgi:hypothetical protein
MALLRRRHLPPEIEGAFESFRVVVELVERAKTVLPEAMPSTRLPGRPLPDVLMEFESQLEAARLAMPAWRRPEVREEWIACGSGISDGLARAERLRLEAPDIGGFEGLIGVLGDLLATLEPFEVAASRFDALRV